MLIYFILEADNPTDNIMYQDILINVIFGCESELWRLRFGIENGIRQGSASAVKSQHLTQCFNNCNSFANKIHIEMFIKFST